MSEQIPLEDLWMRYAQSYDIYLRYTDVHKIIRSTIASDIKKRSAEKSSIIDVCCGTGLFEEEFIGLQNYQITALDGVPEMINVAMKKNQLQQQTMFLQSDATNLVHGAKPVTDAQYDYAVIINGLYAIPDDNKAIDELFRVTKSGGTIFFAGPTPKVDPHLYLQNITKEFKEKGIYKDLEEHINLVNKCNHELFKNVDQLHFYHADELVSKIESYGSIETAHEEFWYNTGHYVVIKKH